MIDDDDDDGDTKLFVVAVVPRRRVATVKEVQDIIVADRRQVGKIKDPVSFALKLPFLPASLLVNLACRRETTTSTRSNGSRPWCISEICRPKCHILLWVSYDGGYYRPDGITPSFTCFTLLIILVGGGRYTHAAIDNER